MALISSELFIRSVLLYFWHFILKVVAGHRHPLDFHGGPLPMAYWPCECKHSSVGHEPIADLPFCRFANGEWWISECLYVIHVTLGLLPWWQKGSDSLPCNYFWVIVWDLNLFAYNPCNSWVERYRFHTMQLFLSHGVKPASFFFILLSVQSRYNPSVKETLNPNK